MGRSAWRHIFSRCGENAVWVRKRLWLARQPRLNIALNERAVQTASRGKKLSLTLRVPLMVSAPHAGKQATMPARTEATTPGTEKAATS